MVAHALGQVIRLGSNLLMTRLLVPEMFGVMAIATTVTVILALLSDIGLRQNIIQSKRGDDPVFLNTAWTVQIIRGLLLFMVSLLVAALAWLAQSVNLWPPASTYAVPILPLIIAVTGFASVVNGFQSTKVATAFRTFQQKRLMLIEIASQLVGLLVVLTIGFLTRSIWSLVAAGLVVSVVNTTLTHVWLYGPRNYLCWDKVSLRELATFGRWVFLSSAVGVLAANGDRILLGGSISVTELGIYSIAGLVMGAFETGFSRIVSSVVFPSFCEAARGGSEHLRAVYHRTKVYVDVAMLFACGFIFATGETLITSLYDTRYSDAGKMLSILSLSIFVWRFTLTYQACLALGLTKYLAIANIIRFVTLWTSMPVLYSIGGLDYVIWGIALHPLPTLPFIYFLNRRLGLSCLTRELAVLPLILVGWLTGAALVFAVGTFA